MKIGLKREVSGTSSPNPVTQIFVKKYHWVCASWFNLQSEEMKKYLLGKVKKEPKTPPPEWLISFKRRMRGEPKRKTDFGVTPKQVGQNHKQAKSRHK